MKKNRWRRIVLALLSTTVMLFSGSLAATNLSQQEINVTFEDTRSTPPPAAETPPAQESTPTPIPFTVDTPASEELRNAKAGSIVSFGTWNQDTDGGKTPLQWIVTEVSSSAGSRVLTLCSLRIIKVDQYHEKYARTSWEKCSLREWLNRSIDFFSAFSSEEKARILPYETGPGLEDMVWIPSPSEWARTDAGIRSKLQGYTKRAAEYASIYRSVMEGFWLRAEEEKSSKAPFVSDPASASSLTEVDQYCGVRPMIRVIVTE